MSSHQAEVTERINRHEPEDVRSGDLVQRLLRVVLRRNDGGSLMITEAQRNLLGSMDSGWALKRRPEGSWFAVHKMGFTKRVNRKTAEACAQKDLITIDHATDQADVFTLTDGGVKAISYEEEQR